MVFLNLNCRVIVINSDKEYMLKRFEWCVP